MRKRTNANLRFTCGTVIAAGLTMMANSESAAQTLYPSTKAEIRSEFAGSVGHVRWEGVTFSGSTERGYGSGFLIGDQGAFLTCKHVLPPPDRYEALKVEIYFSSMDSDPVEPTRLWRSEEFDMELLGIELTADVPTPIARPAMKRRGLNLSSDVELDSEIFFMGWPAYTLGAEPKFPNVTIGQGTVDNRQDEFTWITEATINPGNSGGPVIHKGLAIGVVWGQHSGVFIDDLLVENTGVSVFISFGQFLLDIAARPSETASTFDPAIIPPFRMNFAAHSNSMPRPFELSPDYTPFGSRGDVLLLAPSFVSQDSIVFDQTDFNDDGIAKLIIEGDPRYLIEDFDIIDDAQNSNFEVGTEISEARNSMEFLVEFKGDIDQFVPYRATVLMRQIAGTFGPMARVADSTEERSPNRRPF